MFVRSHSLLKVFQHQKSTRRYLSLQVVSETKANVPVEGKGRLKRKKKRHEIKMVAGIQAGQDGYDGRSTGISRKGSLRKAPTPAC